MATGGSSKDKRQDEITVEVFVVHTKILLRL